MKTLTQDDYDEINRLHKSGLSQKEIAAKYEVSTSTICSVVNGKSKPRNIKYHGKGSTRGPAEMQVLIPEDYASLPDNVLFRHSSHYL